MKKAKQRLTKNQYKRMLINQAYARLPKEERAKHLEHLSEERKSLSEKKKIRKRRKSIKKRMLKERKERMTVRAEKEKEQVRLNTIEQQAKTNQSEPKAVAKRRVVSKEQKVIDKENKRAEQAAQPTKDYCRNIVDNKLMVGTKPPFISQIVWDWFVKEYETSGTLLKCLE